MDDDQAKADEAKTAADLIAAGAKPQLETEKVTLGQLDELFTTGSADLPHSVSGEGEPTTREVVDAPVKKAEPKPGDDPAAAKVEPVVVEEDEVVETRSAEEIEQAQAEARQKVADEGGDEAAQEAAAEAAGKPQAAAKVEEEPVVEEPVVVDDEKEPSKRFRVKDPMARAALELYRAMEEQGTPITLAEAESRVAGPKKEPVKVEPPVDHEKIVTDLETEVAELERQLAEKGEAEGNFDAAAAKLVSDLAEKKGDLKLAKRDQKEAQVLAEAEEQSLRTASEENRIKAHKQAIKEYPDIVDKKTPLGKAVSDRIAKLKADPKHPDRPILFADSAALAIARMVAAELGIAPVVEVSPPAKPKVVAPPRKVVTPAPGGKTAVKSQAQSPEDAKKKTVEYLKNEASLQELDDLFGMGDPSQVLAGAIR